MTDETLRRKVAEYIYDKGLALGMEVRSGIHEAMGCDIDDAIERLETEGYLDRCYDGRWCLVRPYGPVKIDPKPIMAHIGALSQIEHAEGARGAKEALVCHRWGRETVDDLTGLQRWAVCKPGKRVRSGRLFITRRGRAVLHRHRREVAR